MVWMVLFDRSSFLVKVVLLVFGWEMIVKVCWVWCGDVLFMVIELFFE